jgi:hypothetical protein
VTATKAIKEKAANEAKGNLSPTGTGRDREKSPSRRSGRKVNSNKIGDNLRQPTPQATARRVTDPHVFDQFRGADSTLVQIGDRLAVAV